MTSTKALDTATLPKAPAIPASNASYAKIIGKIEGAAKHGAVAVAHVRDTVKGTNTYAKMVRRYADACIAALEAPAPAPEPAKATKPKAKPGEGKANLPILSNALEGMMNPKAKRTRKAPAAKAAA